MAQINFGHFCRQMSYIVHSLSKETNDDCQDAHFIVVVELCVVEYAAKAGIRVACSRLKGETHVAPTSG